MEKKYEKKIKNLISAVILLAGLFVGSLFVDVSQIMRGSGFSQKNLNKSDVFEANGKTWVAYNEPSVVVKVINDDSCTACDPGELLVWLRRVLPTIGTEKIAYDSDEGKKLIKDLEIKTLPAFVLSESVTKTDFYSQAQPLFTSKEGNYFLKAQQIGLAPGKYLGVPEISDADPIVGENDAKVKVVVFSDFQCPYCRLFYKALRETMKTNKDNVVYAFKNFPLNFHPQAENAALAASCAQEQGKFWEYADKLYDTQSSWGNTKDTASFKAYAKTLGLNAVQFDQCLDSKKYQSKIDADKQAGDEFGVAGTPSFFINDLFKNGVVTAAQFGTMIKDALAK